MPVDSEYLHRHYASLSDEALLAINREDLVETAQKCYDHELDQRELASGRGVSRVPGAGDKPGWLEEAAEIYSRADLPGTGAPSEILDARNALDAAGIPSYLDLSEIPEKESFRKPPPQWRLMVPGNLNLHAASVLERDIFNAELAAEWKTHLQTLSDQELRAMTPQSAFCGLFDRVERVTCAYEEEIARRRLRPESI
jgi:hypothetical protein